MLRTTTFIGLVVAAFFFSAVADAAITPADIVAWYGLNGDVLDNGPNGFDGVNNGATFVVDGIRGPVGAFDGTTSSVDVSASGYSITESPNFQFSTSFWIKPTAIGAPPASNAIMGATSSGVIEIVGPGSWGGMGGVNGSIGVNSGGGAGSVADVASIDVYDGNWHHVLMQWVDPDGTVAGNTGAEATIYIDGILGTDSNGATSYNGNGQLAPSMLLGGPVVGSNGGPNDDYYTGLLSDVVFFNRQLTPAEVSEAMALSANAPAGPAVPEPSTFALAALGLLSVGCIMWRRRNS